MFLLRLFFLACLVSGCSGIPLSTSRFESSEVSGGNLAPLLTVAAVEKLKFDPSGTDALIDGDHSALSIHLGASVFDRIELKARDLSLLSAKLQLLGEPRSRAERGNFSLSLGAASTFGWRRRDFGPGNYADHRWQTHEGMLIGGYRFHSHWLLYGGPSLVYLPYRSTGFLPSVSDEVREGAIRARALTAGVEYGSGDTRIQFECTLNSLAAFDTVSPESTCGLGLTGVVGLKPGGLAVGDSESPGAEQGESRWSLALGIGLMATGSYSEKLSEVVSELRQDSSESPLRLGGGIRALRSTLSKKNAFGVAFSFLSEGYSASGSNMEWDSLDLIALGPSFRHSLGESIGQGYFISLEAGLASSLLKRSGSSSEILPSGVVVSAGAGYSFPRASGRFIDLSGALSYWSLGSAQALVSLATVGYGL